MVRLRRRDKAGRTPLLLACGARASGVAMSLLARRDTELNAADEDDRTALHAAAANGLADVMAALLADGIVQLQAGHLWHSVPRLGPDADARASEESDGTGFTLSLWLLLGGAKDAQSKQQDQKKPDPSKAARRALCFRGSASNGFAVCPALFLTADNMLEFTTSIESKSSGAAGKGKPRVPPQPIS